VIGHLGAGAAAARVGQQRHVRPGREPQVRLIHGEGAELDEVVARPRRAELRRRLLAQAPGDRGHSPVGVQHLVVGGPLERRAHAERRLALDGVGQALRAARELRHRDVEHRQAHAACDVDAHRVRDHRLLGGEHAADGQAVAGVGVGHEGTAHRHRQARRVAHLADGGVGDVDAPPLPRRRGLALDEGAFDLAHDGAGHLAQLRIVHECGRVGGHPGETLTHVRSPASAPQRPQRQAHGGALRDPQADDVPPLHRPRLSCRSPEPNRAPRPGGP
jgi:hypothetical protein